MGHPQLLHFCVSEEAGDLLSFCFLMRVKVQKPTTNPMLNFAHFWLCPHPWGQARKEAEKETMPGPRDRKEMEAAHMSMQKPVRAHPLASPQGPSSPPGVHLPSGPGPPRDTSRSAHERSMRLPGAL